MEVTGISCKRSILHLDLDCFYCQVEQKRKGIPGTTPLAVQQWDGLIAVNYAARAKGVTRHMRVAQALEKCPDLMLVHVQTIGEGGVNGADAEGSALNRGSAKACLQRYRMASGNIMRLLSSMLSHGAIMEKAGLDELYLDVTPMVEAELKQVLGCTNAENVEARTAKLLQLAADIQQYSIIEGDVHLDMEMEADQRMTIAAVIAKRLRDAVATHESCGFTCSAGIAPNKVLAKVGSARHKPNKQCVILPKAVAGLMQDIPIGKLRGLGGKFGAALTDTLKAGTAGQVQQYNLDALTAVVGDRAWWVYNIVRGMDTEPVKPKGPIKSLNSCKSFNATSNMAEISKWIQLLAEELAERCAQDEWEHHRRAKSLVLQYRGGGNMATDRSVRCTMPPHTAAEGPSAVALAEAAMNMFRKLPDGLPCARLAMVATEFADPPADSNKAITRFFAPAAACQSTTHAQRSSSGVQAGTIVRKPKSDEQTAAHIKQQLTQAGSAGMDNDVQQNTSVDTTKPVQQADNPAAKRRKTNNGKMTGQGTIQSFFTTESSHTKPRSSPHTPHGTCKVLDNDTSTCQTSTRPNNGLLATQLRSILGPCHHPAHGDDTAAPKSSNDCDVDATENMRDVRDQQWSAPTDQPLKLLFPPLPNPQQVIDCTQQLGSEIPVQSLSMIPDSQADSSIEQQTGSTQGVQQAAAGLGHSNGFAIADQAMIQHATNGVSQEPDYIEIDEIDIEEQKTILQQLTTTRTTNQSVHKRGKKTAKKPDGKKQLSIAALLQPKQ